MLLILRLCLSIFALRPGNHVKQIRIIYSLIKFIIYIANERAMKTKRLSISGQRLQRYKGFQFHLPSHKHTRTHTQSECNSKLNAAKHLVAAFTDIHVFCDFVSQSPETKSGHWKRVQF
jgi:hypothetical protein